MAEDQQYREGGSRKKGRGLPGCLAVLVAALVLVVGFYLAVTKGADMLKGMMAAPGDYPGPGRGKVVFEVQDGDSIAQIGRNLKARGVVKSVGAFTGAAGDEPRATGIQVGFYELKKEMKAEDALAILIEPDNLVQNTVTIPEGLRVTDVLDILAEQTDFDRAAYEKALRQPAKLGLPAYAKGNPEGYLFPATYTIGPKDTPATILTMMVTKWRSVAEDAGLEAGAKALGYTPHELMTVAALVEAEGRGDDMPKIARVIYNRLENVGTAGTTGKLEIDATVNYALGRNLGVALSEEDLAVDSPYNTRLYPGLPPGPIEAPGEAAIKAALQPAEGDWYYWVTVNLKTGETKFASTYDEFLTYKAELDKYCETSEAC